MHEIKTKNFLRDHPHRGFPRWRALPTDEAEAIRSHLASRIGVPGGLQKAALTRLVLDRGARVGGFNALDAGFSVRAVLAHLDVTPQMSVYLNWHQFDDIDEMRIDEVDEYFEYLWYPSSDDLDLFDESFSWVLSISHDGEIRLARLT